MQLQESQVTLRRLVAEEGKVIVSKETQQNEEGQEVPVVRSKEIYLAKNESTDNYIEIDERGVGIWKI